MSQKPSISTDPYSTEFVADLFDRMSATYGLTNYISSFGFTERWRRCCIQQLPHHPRLGKGYDFMTGMGELWASLDPRFKEAEVTGIDISSFMLAQAAKNTSAYSYKIDLLQENVLANNVDNSSADFIVSSFGLKTFSPQQLDTLATEVSRILKPGGVFSFIEISVPKNLLRPFYMFYLKQVIPLIGKIFQGDSDNYRMLGKYTEKFADCTLFHQLLITKGLEVHQTSHFAGCATGVFGRKSEPAWPIQF